MRIRNFFFLFVVASLTFHILTVFIFSLHIDAKTKPTLYCWPQIIKRKDLFIKEKKVQLPKEVDFSWGSLDKSYFVRYPLFFKHHYNASEGRFYPVFVEENKVKKASSYFYLWDMPSFPFFDRQETIRYKVFVSDKGKVIFSYPERLPVDSADAIFLQEYIKESAFSLKDKFFWTKLEAVLK